MFRLSEVETTKKHQRCNNRSTRLPVATENAMDKKYHQWTTIEFCGFLFKNCIHVASPGKCFKFRDIIYQCGYEYVQHSRRQRSSPSKQKDTEIGSLVLGGAALGEQQQQQCIIPTSYVREVGMDGVMMKWFWAEAQQSSAVLLFGRSRGEVVNRTLQSTRFGWGGGGNSVGVSIEVSQVRMYFVLSWGGMLRAYVEQSGGLLTFHLFVGGWWKTFSLVFPII